MTNGDEGCERTVAAFDFETSRDGQLGSGRVVSADQRHAVSAHQEHIHAVGGLSMPGPLFNRWCAAVAPERSRKWGHTSGVKRQKNVMPSTFSGSTSIISRFGERQYSSVSFLLAVLLLTVLPVPSHL